MNNNFDIIIPVAYKDFSFLPKTIKYISQNISPEKIFIILDLRLKHYIPRVVTRIPNVTLVDENKLAPNITYNKIKELLKKNGSSYNRAGWFLQQFIKLGFAQSQLCQKEFYLSWDADTLPLRPISFFSDEGNPFFSLKKEHHEAYFETLSKLFTFEQTANESFIAEHMMFKRSIVCEMIRKIETTPIKGNNWIEKIIYATNPNEINSFSEFETYGNYCLNYHHDVYQQRILNSFRKAGYIAGRFINDKRLHYLGFDLDTASFELGDYPCGFMKYICFIYHMYLKTKGSIIKKII